MSAGDSLLPTPSAVIAVLPEPTFARFVALSRHHFGLAADDGITPALTALLPCGV
jgi:hypothetical protein